MTTTPEQIDFYWRPGCGFCMSLERNLNKLELPLNKINIWESPEGAAFVRSVANGNETVPTVHIGSTSLVNPRAHAVVEALAEEAPDLVPEDYSAGPVSRILTKITRTAG
jgi:mycoredoxin